MHRCSKDNFTLFLAALTESEGDNAKVDTPEVSDLSYFEKLGPGCLPAIHFHEQSMTDSLLQHTYWRLFQSKQTEPHVKLI
jgi:hypothetical protein